MLLYNQPVYAVSLSSIFAFINLRLSQSLSDLLRLSWDGCRSIPLHLGSCRSTTTSLPPTGKILLELTKLRPACNPSLPPRLASLSTEFLQRRPVRGVVVLKFQTTAKFGPELFLGDVLPHVLVERQLLPRKRVDEWCYELEEAPDQPRNCNISTSAKRRE